MKKRNAGKELYQQLRSLRWERLWAEEVPGFDRGTPEERRGRVAVVRAVGVVFSESGPPGLGGEVRKWLRGLLDDPEEKVRRYAMNALPKVGAGREEESELLGLLKKTDIGREKKFLAGALEKIGGERTLAAARGILPQTEQKARAAVARSETPGAIRMDRALENIEGVTVVLRGRRGLESAVRAEVEAGGRFRALEQSGGLVAVEPAGPFALADIYRMRCFGTAGFYLGATRGSAREIAELVASPLALRVFETFTEGPARYRIDFVSKGHQRGAVRELANLVYVMRPEILNDPRAALWSLDIRPAARGQTVELRPRLVPDPRFAYRLQNLPAASHPPLAASMALLAGKLDGETVWDPFCGSGIELVECAGRGARRLVGTDLSAAAIAMAEANFRAAGIAGAGATFARCDFRDGAQAAGLVAGGVGAIVTNPPLGIRVPIRDMRRLIADLFSVASDVLRPGGRLVLVNPLRAETPPPKLRLQSRQLVDMSGFDCRMEVFAKKCRSISTTREASGC